MEKTMTSLVEQTACWSCKAERTFKVVVYYGRYEESEIMHLCPGCLGLLIGMTQEDGPLYSYLGDGPDFEQFEAILAAAGFIKKESVDA